MLGGLVVGTIFRRSCRPRLLFHRFVLKCRRAPIETTSVPTLRLSQFLHERRIHHVHYLKIDAQGADRSIVHDVLSNSKVAIDKMRVECQLLDRATSMYGYSGDSNTMQPNDCRAIVELVRRHRPARPRHAPPPARAAH